MRCFSYILVFFVLPLGAGAQVVAQTQDTANKCCLNSNSVKTMTLEQLGEEYKEMKKYKSSDCCQWFGSRMMQIMEAIADSINTYSFNKTPLSYEKL